MKRALFLFVLLFVALGASLATSRHAAATVEPTAPVPLCSVPQMQPNGLMRVICKPGDGARVAYVYTLGFGPGAWIKALYQGSTPTSVVIGFRPLTGTCYQWWVKDTNGNFQPYSSGWPTPTCTTTAAPTVIDVLGE